MTYPGWVAETIDCLVMFFALIQGKSSGRSGRRKVLQELENRPKQTSSWGRHLPTRSGGQGRAGQSPFHTCPGQGRAVFGQSDFVKDWAVFGQFFFGHYFVLFNKRGNNKRFLL